MIFLNFILVDLKLLVNKYCFAAGKEALDEVIENFTVTKNKLTDLL